MEPGHVNGGLGVRDRDIEREFPVAEPLDTTTTTIITMLTTTATPASVKVLKNGVHWAASWVPGMYVGPWYSIMTFFGFYIRAETFVDSFL